MIWQTCLVNEFYDVSDLGDVRRVETGYVLKQFTNHNGYLVVQLSANGVRKTWRVNRLVLLTFTGLDPDPIKIQVAHVNGNRTDNRLDNLVWKDTYGNFLDRVEHGTQVVTLSADDINLMRNQFSNGALQKDIAKRFGISAAHCSKIVTGARATRG